MQGGGKILFPDGSTPYLSNLSPTELVLEVEPQEILAFLVANGKLVVDKEVQRFSTIEPDFLYFQSVVVIYPIEESQQANVVKCRDQVICTVEIGLLTYTLFH